MKWQIADAKAAERVREIIKKHTFKEYDGERIEKDGQVMQWLDALVVYLNTEAKKNSAPQPAPSPVPKVISAPKVNKKKK